MPDPSLRMPTPEEQVTIATVARMMDRLRAAKFTPSCVILNDAAWGTPENHFTVVLGLPVLRQSGESVPSVQIGVEYD